MRKLKLQVDELRVDTFEVDREAAGRGTVRGNMPFEIPADDLTDGGGGSSGEAICNWTLKYDCTEFCTVTVWSHPGGCCP